MFDASLDQEGARRGPDLFLRNHPPPVILDEIQYAPEVVSAIKRHVDRSGGAEVELLLERDGTLYPVETKLTCNPTRRTVSGILAFRVAYRDRKIGIGTVPCAVDEPRWIAEDALALPWNLSRPTHHATP